MPEKPPQKYQSMKGYVRYSGMATQMLVVIGGFTWGGWSLDKWLDMKPLFVVIGSLLGVAIAMYLIIKDFIPKNKKK
jgi:F0F1-type ATP synthase assembly protein I